MTVTKAANLMSRTRRDPVEIGMLVMGVVVMVVVLVVNTIAFLPGEASAEKDQQPSVVSTMPQSAGIAVAPQRTLADRAWRMEFRTAQEAAELKQVLADRASEGRVFTFERTETLTGPAGHRTIIVAPATPEAPTCTETAPAAQDPQVEAEATAFWCDLMLGLQRWFPGVGTVVERFMASI